MRARFQVDKNGCITWTAKCKELEDALEVHVKQCKSWIAAKQGLIN